MFLLVRPQNSSPQATQPTGYAAHSDHDSRCNLCVGEGVLLVVAQVLAGAGQFVGGVGGLCFGQTSDLLRGDACKQQEVLK